MANDIDKTNSHYKGEFGSIYEVNQKYPSGGVSGDYVDIDGWAHYWNADRGTWCVNAQRDSYWDELSTNIIERLKNIKGATYMGVATTSTVPDTTATKMYYFALAGGKYTNFGNIDISAGISVLITEDGKSWKGQNLLKVVQEIGTSATAIISQKGVSDALSLKATKEEFSAAIKAQAALDEKQDVEISKKATKDELDAALKAQAAVDAGQDTEIAKKANASEVQSAIDEINSKHILLSEDEYNALETKDSNKIYMVYEDED